MFTATIGIPFIPDWTQLRPFVAELWLIASIVAVLLVPFWSKRSNAISGVVAFAGLAVALLSLLISGPAVAGFYFRGMLVADNFAYLWKILLLTFSLGVVVMWFLTTAASMHEGDAPEFFTLLLGAALGMCFMSSTSNLLMIFLAVEMASLPSYVLAGFRKTDRLGSEASLKYVLFGAATSSIMVYGLSMLYGLYGTLQIEEIAMRLDPAAGLPLIVGIAALIVGIGFKISAVPFHFWCPDVFQGAGVDVAAFLSVASKGAGLTLLLRILMTLSTGAPLGASPIILALAIAIGVLGAVTATVGNTGAFVQNNIKRLLAYSSIAHAGYMLCALSLLLKSSPPPAAAAQALLLYLAVYLVMNLGAFTVAGLIGRATGGENIEDYAGLGRRNPMLAMAMAVFMFSLVGLPPFAGFMAKLNVMIVLARGGTWFWVLVAVIGVNTIFSLYYYARVIRSMYLVESDRPPVRANPLGAAMSLGCAAVLLIMLLAFQPFQKLIDVGSRMHLSNTPAAKVDAVAKSE